LFFIIVLLPLVGQTEKKIVLLHTNDLHSRLTGYAPESAYSPLSVNDDKTKGGFARIATILKTEKDNNRGNTLVINAGDFLMGTLFAGLEEKNGFQLRLMKAMGYDIVGLGNHEFDFGPDKLASIINASVKNGEIPSLLIGNTEFDEKDRRDDNLEKLFSDGVITRKRILIKDGIKIGIFSIIGKDADRVAPNAVPVTFTRQYGFARKMVKELKNEHCEIIICVSHSGLVKGKNGEWTGEDVKLAKKVSGIDIIISGHTHTLLDKPLTVNGVNIVQAGEFGQYVGRMSLIYSARKLKVESYELIPVDDKIVGDNSINQLIENQKGLVTSEILKPLGMDYSTPVAETDFTLGGNSVSDYLESNIGPLVADAIHFYINRHTVKGADVSIIAAGMLFDNIVPGIQTAPDIFRVVSLGSGKDNIPGYPLSRLYVTGRELKSIFEILQVAYKSSPDNYCYFSGVRVLCDPGKGLFRKIKKIDIVHPDGSVTNVDFSKKNKSLYSVTADSYMLEFIGIIKKMSFGLVNVVPKDFSGNRILDMKTTVIDMDENIDGIQEGKEWLALLEYIHSMIDIDKNGIPNIDKKYSVPVKCFYTEE